jgi:hypothetical protein
MTARATTRKLQASPPYKVEVVLGHTQSGERQANVSPWAYGHKSIALRDPAVVRELIADLGEALAYLEVTA